MLLGLDRKKTLHKQELKEMGGISSSFIIRVYLGNVIYLFFEFGLSWFWLKEHIHIYIPFIYHGKAFARFMVAQPRSRTGARVIRNDVGWRDLLPLLRLRR